MPVLHVQHVTTYRYRRPVGFGEHRMMFRPRDSVDQRIVSWSVDISPVPFMLRSVPDAFGNVVTLAGFNQRARELRVENRLVVDHEATVPEERHVAPYARIWPFTYDLDDMEDLGRVMQRHYPDPEHKVDSWARSFLAGAATTTLDLLVAINSEIRRGFTYCARYEEGVQPPARTLALRAGTCRDYAVLMMEAVRALCMAARFVTGYIYSPSGRPGAVQPGQGSALDPDGAHEGSGATHAWVEVFVPGVGWIDFDPTNGIVGSRDLIRVASVRDPNQAIPLAGTWTGFPADSLGMTVAVRVTAAAAIADDGDAQSTARAGGADGRAGPGDADIVQLPSRERSATQSANARPGPSRGREAVNP